ncbi:MAG: aldehyde dehydrogenase family protein [Rhodoluna sp.]|nr:aldehyde dehydrogenase family protein [Rhodoluna sp.]
MTDTSIAGLISHFAPTDKTHAVINPTSAKRIYDLPQLSAEQVALEVDRARDAQADWAAMAVFERANIMLMLHDVMLVNKDKLLDLLQLETGKARAHAVEEFAGALGATRYYAKIADKALSLKKAKTGVPILLKSFVAQAPVGVVGVITPWNYPLALAMMDVIPALMAGNSVVHKVDNQTALVSLFARALAVELGLPGDVWRIVAGDGAEVGNAVTDNVDYVAFTGSTATGRVVAGRAAARLIGCSLELGGKNPAIVLSSAKIKKAAAIVAAGAFGNTGQLCVALSRIYVPNTFKAEFETELVEVVESLKVGKSNDFEFDIGSLTSAAQLGRVEKFVKDAKDRGARVLTGGQALPEVGPYFYQPTVVTDIGKDVLMRCDEVFGPVVGIYGYDDIEDAIDMANDSDYGLNASIIGNRKEAIRISHFIEAGGVNINEGYRATFASFGAPMGGFKLSGVGRRSGVGGLLRYTEARTVGVAKTLLGIGLPLNARGWKRMAPLMDLLAKIQRRLP